VNKQRVKIKAPTGYNGSKLTDPTRDRSGDSGRNLLETDKRKWEDNIKMDLKQDVRVLTGLMWLTTCTSGGLF
jgi:hypothetical protein